MRKNFDELIYVWGKYLYRLVFPRNQHPKNWDSRHEICRPNTLHLRNCRILNFVLGLGWVLVRVRNERWFWLNFIYLCTSAWSNITNNLCTHFTGIIMCIGPANERRRYIVTSSLIGSAHTKSIGSANERRRYILTSSLIGSAHTKNGPRFNVFCCGLIWVVFFHDLEVIRFLFSHF